ncbi:hypothetical protein GCM10007301_43140 [Azorhizobium oxalatiphilum]|uniref:Methyltransferase domain-containing protein n=1 Tax=Azorhizobium oxalatiphilum TaxID=980631 RepID=A0A917FHZ1_9HYPH|nr:class I SAM-dependent methyltransferase [Azorhizobium oxalatiphilum]GGF78538.1 hypothetical protein GCM10007301_43140 [Azorhizobium oxalatiphilum]
MNSWTHGYVHEVDYTHGFYRELTPAVMALAALRRGKRVDLPDEGATYCELGCGHGFSVNLLAAANPHMDFHANDFLPAHVAGARRLARDASLPNAHFYEHGFADFAAAPGLPASFDIIALHGVYSWVSEESRRHVIDFIAARLKPGGLVYVSYNALPGLAAVLPLRRLLVDHAGRGAGPMLGRIEEALGFATSAQEADAIYFRHSPDAGARLKQMKTMSANYLAHEYFNLDWEPFYFEDVASALEAAKLSFVGSANLIEQADELALTDAQRALLAGETDPLRREGLRDFMVNEQFRKDLFVKGPMDHTFRSGVGVWLNTRFALVTARAHVPAMIKGRRRNLELDPQVHGAILDALQAGPVTVRQMLGVPAVAALNFDQITNALGLLVGAGQVQPCLPEAGEAERAERCRAFNLAVCTRSEETEDFQFLASPVTGGGVVLNRFEQLFLVALREGHETPAQWATFVWQVLAPQGHKLVKDGRMLETAEENLAELLSGAELFARERLPLCRTLGLTL